MALACHQSSSGEQWLREIFKGLARGNDFVLQLTSVRETGLEVLGATCHGTNLGILRTA
jgi:hypothetical protein